MPIKGQSAQGVAGGIPFRVSPAFYGDILGVIEAVHDRIDQDPVQILYHEGIVPILIMGEAIEA